MGEKNVKPANGQFVKERFSFELRINDNIICQRYFRINGFKSQSLQSQELTDTLVYCADLIKKDLKDKTNMFNWYTAPQIFKNEEEMEEHLKDPKFRIEPYRYIIFEDDEKTVYFWDGYSISPYTKYFNRVDYLPSNEAENTLKLAFLDNDREVCSTIWDGNIYPRFIRTNIDLSNSKNKYKQEGQISPMEAAMVAMMNDEHEDLIPVIVKEFCVTCSYGDVNDYTRKVQYGDKIYNLNIEGENRKYLSQYDKAFEHRKNA